MSGPAVKAFDLGKRYMLGQQTGGYTLLTDRLRGRARTPRPQRDAFWALRDIGFEVAQGETFGVIGHNGAGKSTLLKILSRVTTPTTGGVDLNGRVGALLEVGTGFHPELTGRENVYLNGALLGMRNSEVAARFDEIVAFAEVERFIDTPVKRYSSGMYLRLAFAVAAHLEPEILIVDEVLSVGDLAFQEKCLGRMRTVAGEGRTVIFVSHNLAAVSAICTRSMLLQRGQMIEEGATPDVLRRYIREARTGMATRLDERTDRQGNGALHFTNVGFEVGGEPVELARTGEELTVVIGYETRDGQPLRNTNFSVSVNSLLGERLLDLPTELSGARFDELPAQGELRCVLPRCPLPDGAYWLNLFSHQGGDVVDWIQRAVELPIAGGDFYGSGQSARPDHQAVLVDYHWTRGS
jgi:lipopolysaccharide transport system ATP-binding protein